MSEKIYIYIVALDDTLYISWEISILKILVSRNFEIFRVGEGWRGGGRYRVNIFGIRYESIIVLNSYIFLPEGILWLYERDIENDNNSDYPPGGISEISRDTLYSSGEKSCVFKSLNKHRTRIISMKLFDVVCKVIRPPSGSLPVFIYYDFILAEKLKVLIVLLLINSLTGKLILRLKCWKDSKAPESNKLIWK